MQKPQLSAMQEARFLLIIAAPLMAAYVAEFSMFITTKLVVGSLAINPSRLSALPVR